MGGGKLGVKLGQLSAQNFMVCTGGENWSRVVATALDPRKHDLKK